MDPLWKTIAEEIRGKFLQGAANRVPSARELSRLLGVSRPVVARALDHWRTEGLLVFRRGSAIHRADSGDSAAGADSSVRAVPALNPVDTRKSAVERVAALVRQRIGSGVYRVGQPFPKTRYLAASEGVSLTTVSIVLRRLVREGALHRRGRRLWIGPARPDVGLAHRGEAFGEAFRQTIMVVCSRPGQWASICTSERTERFGQNFTQEAERAGVRLLLAAYKVGVANRGVLGVTPDTLGPTVKSLGHNYRGALFTAARRELPDSAEWLHALVRLGRPVAWIDCGDEGWEKAPIPGVRRFGVSEESIAAAVADYLHGYGHRTALFLRTSDDDWQISRFKALAAAGRALNPALALVDYAAFLPPSSTSQEIERIARLKTCAPAEVQEAMKRLAKRRQVVLDRFSEQIDPQWRDAPGAEIVAASRANNLKAGPVPMDMLNDLSPIWSALALLPFFENGRITAVLAPNDSLASSFHMWWLQTLGLSAPADVSLLAFDNARRYGYIPPTTVDFGFGQLGYLALHYLLGDITIQGGGNTVVAEAKVIEGGTVGKARPRV